MNSLLNIKPAYLWPILIGLVFILAELSRTGDFGIFMQASEALYDGINPYVISYGDGFKYYYSVLFAQIMYPLTLLPHHISATIWNLFSLIALIRLFYILRKMFFAESTHAPMLVVWTLLASAFLLYANFHTSQMTAFMLFASFEGLYQIAYRKRKIFGASILACAINIKLFPLVLLPYLIYRKEFLAVGYTIICVIGFLFLPALFVGWDFNLSLLKSYWNIIHPAQNINIYDVSEPGLHSITSLLTTLFSTEFNNYELGWRRHIVVLDEHTLMIIIHIVRLGFIALTLYFLRWPPFVAIRQNQFGLWEIAYICLIIPVIFPHQQTYGFLFALPAVFYVINFLWFSNLNITDQRLKIIRGLTILSFLTINLQLILGTYRKFLWNYKSLTYGILLLVVVLLLCNPKRIKPGESHRGEELKGV